MLYLNEETGEWYTIDDDTPLDAAGNPIIPSGTTPTAVGSTSWLKGISDLFRGTGGLGGAGQLLALGGVGTLLSKMLGGGGGGGGFSGYQGGIPSYTASRTQTPITEQRPTSKNASGATVAYRPGQGGITYFTPMQYTPAPATTQPPGNAAGGFMPSGIAMLAGGGQGGRYLRGPGDGVSDSIPAQFAGSGRPARLADGEFVIDARTVSEIGNGSSEAGARKLYAMMERVHKARKKAKRGEPSGADRHLPK
jgi:hypothetical protein